MTQKGLLQELERRGFSNARPWRIHSAIATKKISTPPLDESHRYVFGPEHVDQMSEILRGGK